MIIPPIKNRAPTPSRLLKNQYTRMVLSGSRRSAGYPTTCRSARSRPRWRSFPPFLPCWVRPALPSARNRDQGPTTAVNSTRDETQRSLIQSSRKCMGCPAPAPFHHPSRSLPHVRQIAPRFAALHPAPIRHHQITPPTYRRPASSDHVSRAITGSAVSPPGPAPPRPTILYNQRQPKRFPSPHPHH